MTDDLDFRYGGAIAVDTEALRDVGRRLDAVVARLHDAKEAIARAHGVSADAGGFDGELDLAALAGTGERIGVIGEETRDASGGTLLMADAYEVVELRAQAEARGAGDAASARVAQARLDQLLAGDPRVGTMADWLVSAWEKDRFDGLGEQIVPGGLMTSVFLAAAYGGVVSGAGTVPQGAMLRGTADPVSITAVRTTTPKGAPSSLADAMQRFASAPGSQIRVEKYTMADGERRFVAYVTGTQSPAFGGSQPWDMRSNSQMYSGERSSSYQATIDALTAAGANPGDRVDLVGHSQGGMIAGHIAMESEFDVGVTITAGSPNEPTLRDDQLLVQLRHTDDIVSSLAGGGAPGGTGSPDSFTATRVGDPIPGAQDILLAPHQHDSYLATAEMVDASGDRRVEALDELWSELDQAVEVTATDYRAERTG